MKRYGIVLGAGMGTRMKSSTPKVLHQIMGKGMIEHVINTLETINIEKIVVVTGHKAELVEEVLGSRVLYAHQSQQLGTAHATMMTHSHLQGLSGITIVTYGDGPLLTKKTLDELFAHHENTGAKMTLLSAHTEHPTGYGRIIRDNNACVVRIVEQKDATEEELEITEINSGVACFDNEVLFEGLAQVENNNSQGEFYLTDLVEIISNLGHKVEAVVCQDFTETLGVNDRVQLAEASRKMQHRINEKHMRNGVTIVDPLTTYIESDVEIANDTIIEPNVHLRGTTIIETGAVIGTGAQLTNAKIGANTYVQASVITDSEVGANTTVGPYAHLRGGSSVGEGSRIGNFVEIKNTTLGQGVKAAHLSYMGDANIGDRVNMSCGAIIANYDGKEKHQTIIGADTMIGSNVNLIAPVEIGANAYVAAGSTINHNVPDEALAIARARQENKLGYVVKQPEE